MIEDYGTLSEEELLEEIMHRIEENGEIDASDLDFKFEEDRLVITGSLQTEEEIEALTTILEDYLDPKDYSFDIDVAEAPDKTFKKGAFKAAPEEEEEFEEDEEDEDFDDEGLEEVDEEDMEIEEEDDDFDDDKW